MAIADFLAAAQGGQYFANAGKASDLSEADARAAISAIAPAVAEKLKDKAAADPEAFDQLLDLLEDGGEGLEDVDATTGSEAIEDGAAILKDLYGSDKAAQAALQDLAPHASGAALEKIGAISATSVLASLAASNANTLASDTASASGGSGGGIFNVILAALLKGLMSGAMKGMGIRQRRRPRRRYTYGYGAPRPRRRRRKTRPPLERIFRDVLGGRR
jgi:hypothetical protein